ncbi:MAG: glycosyltransferase [Aquisalimonadaceae bacterium]
METGRRLYGGALQVRYLMDGLARRGIESILVCPPGADVASAAAMPGIRVVHVSMRGEADLAFSVRLFGVLRRERPDIVHVHSRRGADMLSAPAARMAGVPAVLSRRVDNAGPDLLTRARCRLYGRVITISEAIRQVLLNASVPAGHIRCVLSAVDTALYRPGGDRGWLRREFGLPERGPVLAVVAQLIRRKGHRDLLAVLPRLLEAHPDLRVLFLGRGPEEAVLRDQVRRNGLGEVVCFAGFRDDLPRILPALDLVIHPACGEGLGVSLLQAAACGIPLVGTRVGGIPEVIRDGETGLLVPPADVNALTRAVSAILEDPALGLRLGRGGREWVEQVFSIDSMVEGNLRVYAELLDGK